MLTRFARFVAPGAIPGRLLTVGPLGTANANTAWQSTTAAAPTVGTTSITFARVGGLGGSQFAVADGTADALTATFGILPALVDGLQFSVRATSANATATPTFNPNSLGALTICKLGGAALRAGDIAGAGHELILRYRASPARYELLNPKGLASVVPGSNVTVDTTDPFNPVVASTAMGIGLKGRLAAYVNLPSSGNTAGDAYLLDSDSLIYIWNGTSWPASGAGLISAFPAAPAWTNATLGNAWAAYGAPFAPPGYYKDVIGTVHLRGLMKNGTINAAAFTLPAGFRPEYTYYFVIVNNGAAKELTISASGQVTVVTGGGNAYAGLDGVSFRAFS